jgi:multiple sugar transport system ATP-binding protein
MNVFKGRVQAGTVEALGARWPLPPGSAGGEGRDVHYGIRPTDLGLGADGIAAKVVVVPPST